ncbi:unnamed protein product [Urochloa humidicola]
MSDLPLEINSNNAANMIGVNLGEFADAAADGPDASSQLARLLFAVGFFTMLMDVATALYKAPGGLVFRSHKLAYYLTLAAIFAFGIAEVSTAFCTSRYRNSERVRAFARATLCISVMPLVGVIALGGFAVVMRS